MQNMLRTAEYRYFSFTFCFFGKAYFGSAENVRYAMMT